MQYGVSKSRDQIQENPQRKKKKYEMTNDPTEIFYNPDTWDFQGKPP